MLLLRPRSISPGIVPTIDGDELPIKSAVIGTIHEYASSVLAFTTMGLALLGHAGPPYSCWLLVIAAVLFHNFNVPLRVAVL